jgi:hypothetical protein
MPTDEPDPMREAADENCSEMSRAFNVAWFSIKRWGRAIGNPIREQQAADIFFQGWIAGQGQYARDRDTERKVQP